MKALFILLRIMTGLSVTSAIVVLLGIVLLRSGAVFLKEGVVTLGYVAKLFMSGFTEGTPPEAPRGLVVSMPQVGLAVLFVAMIVSVLLPGARILLHAVAAMAGLAMIWYVRLVLTDVKLEILCLPLLAVWFLYYVMCIFWSGNQPLPGITGS